jgi:hypothetical protein
VFAEGGNSWTNAWIGVDDSDVEGTPTPFVKQRMDTRFVPSVTEDSNRMTIKNMTCDFFTQPL